jgi:predicted dehydrogenase
MKRRKFIGQAATGVAAFTIIPGTVLGKNGSVAANDRINLGYIGTGKQNRYLVNQLGKCPGVLAVAACDVDSRKLEWFRKIAANANKTNLTGQLEISGYKNYRELLDRNDIDAVVVATPDHWHAQVVVDAAKAGKDIYCEKPMALTVAEGRAMVDATRKYNRVFQTGNMQRSWRDFRHAVELIRNGYIGEIKEVNVNVGNPVVQCDLPTEPVPDYLDWDMWVGPSLFRGFNAILSPPIEKDIYPNWRMYRDFGGGGITDWGAHMFDIAQWALDMDESGPVEFMPPMEQATRGLKMVYKNGIVMNHVNWGESNAVQFIGTEGKIEVSRSFLRTFPDEKLAKTELKPGDKRVYYSDNHYQDWINAMKTRKRPVSDVEVGHRTASVCNLANIAYELQRTLKWNPHKERFTDKYANLMLSRPIRGKWDFTNFQ